MTRILFACLRNICRSLIAEGLLRERIVIGGGKTEFFVNFAATSTYEARKTSYPGTKKVLNQEGVDMMNMVAQQITPHDFETSGWVTGMDQENIKELKRRALRLT